jgi:hypothetical protein
MTACERVCLTGTLRVPLPPKEAITPSTPTGNAPGHRGGHPSSQPTRPSRPGPHRTVGQTRDEAARLGDPCAGWASSGVVHRPDRDQLRLVISHVGCGWPR